jgi:hypothetical protein
MPENDSAPARIIGAMNQGRNGQTGANLTADLVWSARAGKRIHGR